MLISQVSYNNITQQVGQRCQKPQKHVGFTAATPIATESKIFKGITDKYNNGVEYLAKGLGKLLDTQSAYKISECSKRHKGRVFSGLLTLASFIMSGLYIKKTLDNKELDEKKKRTLALNQAIVFGISTIMCYTVDGALNNKIGDFVNKFEAVNAKMNPKTLKKCLSGISIAKTLIVFDVIYRFIAPVIVTPIANHFGNKINDKKAAELVSK